MPNVRRNRPKQHSLASLHAFLHAIPELVTYRLGVVIIQALIIGPLVSLALAPMLALKGIPVITNDNLASIILSPIGPIFIIGAAALVAVTVVVEIGGFITVSGHDLNRRRQAPFRTIVTYALSVLPRTSLPGLAAILGFSVVALPIVQQLMTVSLFSGIRIPNFIMEVITSTPMYHYSYLAVVIIVWIITGALLFWFHGIVLLGYRPGRAARLSVQMMRKHGLAVIGRLLLVNLLAALAVVVLTLIPLVIVLIGGVVDEFTDVVGIVITAVGLALLSAVFTLASFISVPFELFLLTALFYRFVPRDLQPNPPCEWGQFGPRPRLKELRRPTTEERFKKHPRIALAVAAVALLGFSGYSAASQLAVTSPHEMMVVAHRGGAGDTVVENTLEAIAESERLGATAVEIDVQRTADGYYILNHDNTFSRLAGDSRAVNEMTLNEIQQLKLQPSNQDAPPLRIPTIEQTLASTAPVTTIFMEMKGPTADRRMADDLYEIVRSQGALNRVVFFSLNGDLIDYVQTTYPDTTTAYGYFLSGGDMAKLPGNWAAVEEDNISISRVNSLHDAGKKVAVWTVNSEDSMKKFVYWPVDAVITDHVEQFESIRKQREEKTHFEVLIDQYRFDN